MIIEKKDLVIIGSGPGGYTSALRASQLGRKVMLIEKDKIGGVCLNRGCIPTKYLLSLNNNEKKFTEMFDKIGENELIFKLSKEKINENKFKATETLTRGLGFLFKKQKIEVISGEAFFEDEETIKVKVVGVELVPTRKDESENEKILKFNQCIIATGSLPFVPPPLKPVKGKILSGEEFLYYNFEELPKDIIIVGGGVMSVEFAQILNFLKRNVTIIEIKERILHELPSDLSNYFSRIINKEGVKIKTNCFVSQYNIEEEKVNLKLSNEETLSAGLIIVCANRVPNNKSLNLQSAKVDLDKKGFIIADENFKTSNNKIFAIGDIIGPPFLAHKSSHQAISCAEKICSAVLSFTQHTAIQNSKLEIQNYNSLIPGCIYTHPEIAFVGLTEEKLKEQNIEYVTGKHLYQAVGRAVAVNEKEGFFKIIAEKNTHKILGMQIIGENASELIAGGILMLHFNATLEDITSCMFPHPTLSEGIYETARQMVEGVSY